MGCDVMLCIVCSVSKSKAARHGTARHYTALHYALYCNALHCTTPRNSTLYVMCVRGLVGRDGRANEDENQERQ